MTSRPHGTVGVVGLGAMGGASPPPSPRTGASSCTTRPRRPPRGERPPGARWRRRSPTSGRPWTPSSSRCPTRPWSRPCSTCSWPGTLRRRWSSTPRRSAGRLAHPGRPVCRARGRVRRRPGARPARGGRSLDGPGRRVHPGLDLADLLAPVAARVVPVGDVGAGATVKVVNNQMLAIINAGTAEALALAAAAGLDPGVFVDTVIDSGAASVSGLFRDVAPAPWTATTTRSSRSSSCARTTSWRWPSPRSPGSRCRLSAAALALHTDGVEAGLKFLANSIAVLGVLEQAFGRPRAAWQIQGVPGDRGRSARDLAPAPRRPRVRRAARSDPGARARRRATTDSVGPRRVAGLAAAPSGRPCSGSSWRGWRSRSSTACLHRRAWTRTTSPTSCCARCARRAGGGAGREPARRRPAGRGAARRRLPTTARPSRPGTSRRSSPRTRLSTRPSSTRPATSTSRVRSVRCSAGPRWRCCRATSRGGRAGAHRAPRDVAAIRAGDADAAAAAASAHARAVLARHQGIG